MWAKLTSPCLLSVQTRGWKVLIDVIVNDIISPF